jgi:hypothetical protein
MNDEPSTTDLICGTVAAFSLLAILWTVAAIF